jgi:hypothetical protein
MDDVEQIIEFSDEIFIIKTDKTLWRFKNTRTDGVTDYTETVKATDDLLQKGSVVTDFAMDFTMDFEYIIPEKSGQNEGKPKYGITSDGTVVFLDSGITVATGVKL